MGEVVPEARAEGSPRRALIRPRHTVLRPLGRRVGNRVAQRDGQVRCRGGVERGGVHRSHCPHTPAQLEPCDAQCRFLQQLAHARLCQLEAQLQRVGLHGRTRHDAGPRDGQLLFGTLQALPGHAQQLCVREHRVILGLGELRRREPGFELTGVGRFQGGPRPRQFCELLTSQKQVVASGHLRRHLLPHR